MARQTRKVLFEVQTLDGRKLKVDFDRYCYAVSEWKISEKTNEGSWVHVPGPYFGTMAGAVRRLHQEQLAILDGLAVSNVALIMDKWGRGWPLYARE